MNLAMSLAGPGSVGRESSTADDDRALIRLNHKPEPHNPPSTNETHLPDVTHHQRS